jgi:hypothetical protein
MAHRTLVTSLIHSLEAVHVRIHRCGFQQQTEAERSRSRAEGDLPISVDRELNFGVRVNRDTGQPYLVLCGYEWPEAWQLPDGIAAADFDPYQDEAVYSQGANGFKDLLRQLAPFLEEPLTIQAIGNTGSLFPLSACEWHVEPSAANVDIIEFRHGQKQHSA